jgi:hypothetical protein
MGHDFFKGEGFPGVFRSSSFMGKVRDKIQSRIIVCIRSCVCALMLVSSNGLSSEQAVSEPPQSEYSYNDPIISKLKPERARGRGFKLEYLVNAPLDIFWSFKTNFDSDLLHKNKYITSHKLVSREEGLVITETEYSYKPGKTFNWQTTVLPGQNLLKYELLNPDECGQKYHYGYIQLEPEGKGTRVTHVAYFDFFGASFWVNYPFKGGMSDFLKYTALWEQEFVMELEHQYQ